MIELVIIDYGSGNLRSAAKACERAMAEHQLQGRVVVSSDPQTLEKASHIVLPGVGAFADCLAGLKAIPDLLATLETQVKQKQTWFLGICVGMQLLFDKGEEHGTHEGLGWIPGEVKKFDVDTSLKVPHMGWNNIVLSPRSSTDSHMGRSSGLERSADRSHTHTLFADIEDGAYMYFVHSYHAQNVPAEYILATTEYGGQVLAAVGKDNLFGTQFHPEKSQAAGIELLANFLKL